MVPTLRGDGTIYWAADSDSALTKVPGSLGLLTSETSGSLPTKPLPASLTRPAQALVNP